MNFLKENNHSYPLIYMCGTKGKDLICVIDLIYHGQVSILQET